MKKALILRDETALGGGMWEQSLRFYHVEYAVADVRYATAALLEETGLVILTADCVPGQSADLLEKYVQSGGRLILSGCEARGFADNVLGLTLRRMQRGNDCRCICVGAEGLGCWKSGEILMFTNTINSGGRDVSAAGWENSGFQCLCGSMKMNRLANRSYDSWQKDEEPTAMLKQAGQGKVLVIPIPLDEMTWVEQPEIPFFQWYPFQVKNYALMRFVESLNEILETGLAFAPLWPDGARTVVCITGDVHDYEGIEGRFDREYRDMQYNCRLLEQFGLGGCASFYMSAIVAKRHPAEVAQTLSEGYEICPHTYIETQYLIENWSEERQEQDIKTCIETFRKAYPQSDVYCKGFRTHGYQSDFNTRTALENLGYDYLADLQAWECSGSYDPGFPEGTVTYLGLPQHACDSRGRVLNLLEIPDTVGNDHFCYRLKGMNPEEALAFWKKEFDRIHRLGGLFQTCLHPYISIQEGEGREQTYRDLITYMHSFGDVKFMTMGELAAWWRKRNGEMRGKEC